MRQIFLPLGLILALINALVLPGGGLWIAEHLGIKLFILITFLISGDQTGTKGLGPALFVRRSGFLSPCPASRPHHR
jgi:hypothetical protein